MHQSIPAPNAGNDGQKKVLERLNKCNEYEERLIKWEAQLQTQALAVEMREKDINARELRIIERM